VLSCIVARAGDSQSSSFGESDMFGQKLSWVLASIVSGILLSVSATAAESWHTSTIKWVYPFADGTFVLTFETNAADCTNANPNKYHYVTFNQNGMTEEGAKKLYAAALMALATDKTVTVAFDNASYGCYINRLIVVK
jgi:hypothetical protein